MAHKHQMSRRAFVTDLGKGTIAVALFGITAVACSAEETAAETTATPTTGAEPGTSTPTTSTTAAPATTTVASSNQVAWERVKLGSVSAYILARRGEATIVDTGVSGSETSIEEGLGSLDLEWSDVAHVIVTHLHGDHQGSLPAVMNLAPDATAYAGTADLPGISSPREITGVGDGDTVFGLEIIDTPGHTPGHISVYDRAGGLLVAGDSMNGAGGGVVGANPDFTPDMDTANQSIQKMAALPFDTVLFGHGDPVAGGASALVIDLAATLG